MRIGLVGCVKSKQPLPARARDLYVSPLFRGRREWVERTCDQWFILSALHGLVAPDEVLAPYDRTLNAASTGERTLWARRVIASLEDRLGNLGGHEFEIHAGANYRDFGLVATLQARGVTVTIPAAGLGQGKQLAFYARVSAPTPSAAPAPRPSAPAPTLSASPASRAGSYRGLADALRGLTSNPPTWTFEEIAAIIGRPLPTSAHRHRAWWSNSRSHSHASAWLDAGYLVDRVDLTRRTVQFRRSS